MSLHDFITETFTAQRLNPWIRGGHGLPQGQLLTSNGAAAPQVDQVLAMARRRRPLRAWGSGDSVVKSRMFIDYDM